MGNGSRRPYSGFSIISVLPLIHLKCPYPSIYTTLVLKIVTLFNTYLYNALHTRTNPVPINPLLHYFGWAESPRQDQPKSINIENKEFEQVKSFTYLGSTVNTDNTIEE